VSKTGVLRWAGLKRALERAEGEGKGRKKVDKNKRKRNWARMWRRCIWVTSVQNTESGQGRAREEKVKAERSRFLTGATPAP